ncbi:MAG: AAA family ATPase [Dehalococcoidia bacterium]
MSAPLRAGTTTILFTDLVNSTELLQEAGDERALRVLEAHHRLLREAVARCGGEEVKWTGDGLMVAFPSTGDAVRCAIIMQQSSHRPAAGERLSIRVGLHVGEALRHDMSDYFGTTVVVAKRLCDKADAGQILITRITAELLAGHKEFDFRDVGALNLKGIAQPTPASEVLYRHDTEALLAHTPFVGRTAELAALQRKFETAQGAEGSVVMLVGEPGIGKSRIATELCDHARSRGATTLWGRCYDGDWAAPFSPFVEALTQYVNAEPSDLASDFGSCLSVLARLVPAIREQIPGLPEPGPLEPEGERHRLLEAVGEFLSTLSTKGSVVLVLDDLHWADRGTLAVLRHVATAATSERLLIVGTYRDVEVEKGHPLAALLADLHRLPQFERLQLRGLTAQSVGELLSIVGEHDAPQALVEAISSETSGNPFFIREVLLHLVEDGKLFREGDRWTSNLTIAEMGIPDGAREVIARRLARLGDTCNRMLTTASALTGGFTWEEIRAICGEDEENLVDGLEQALAAQLLRERSDTQRVEYDFTHALIRHTLYDGLSRPRRALLHRRIAGALEALYAASPDQHMVRLAHHFLEGAAEGADLDKAVAYGVRAGEAAYTRYAYEDAADYYRRALALHERSPGAGQIQRCDLMMMIARAEWDCGEFLRAQEEFAAAATLAEEIGSADHLARAALGDGANEWLAYRHQGQHEVSLARLARALDVLGEARTPLRARVMSRLAAEMVLDTDHDRKVALAREAVSIVRETEDQFAVAAVLLSANSALWMPDNTEERLALTRDAAEASERLGRRDITLYARTMHGLARLELGQIAEVAAGFKRLAPLADELRHPYERWVFASWDATQAILEGRIEEAEQLALRALEIGRSDQNENALHQFGGHIFEIRREQGRLQELLPTVGALVDQLPTVQVWRCARAMMHTELGNEEAARNDYEHVAASRFAGIQQNFLWLASLSNLAEVNASLGDEERAHILYEMLSPYARTNIMSTPLGPSLGFASRDLGVLATTMRRWDEAARHFEDALVLNESMGSAPFVARTRRDYAAMLLRRGREGDADHANELLGAARQTAASLGLTRLTERIDALRTASPA